MKRLSNKKLFKVMIAAALGVFVFTSSAFALKPPKAEKVEFIESGTSFTSDFLQPAVMTGVSAYFGGVGALYGTAIGMNLSDTLTAAGADAHTNALVSGIVGGAVGGGFSNGGFTMSNMAIGAGIGGTISELNYQTDYKYADIFNLAGTAAGIFAKGAVGNGKGAWYSRGADALKNNKGALAMGAINVGVGRAVKNKDLADALNMGINYAIGPAIYNQAKPQSQSTQQKTPEGPGSGEWGEKSSADKGPVAQKPQTWEWGDILTTDYWKEQGSGMLDLEKMGKMAGKITLNYGINKAMKKADFGALTSTQLAGSIVDYARNGSDYAKKAPEVKAKVEKNKDDPEKYKIAQKEYEEKYQPFEGWEQKDTWGKTQVVLGQAVKDTGRAINIGMGVEASGRIGDSVINLRKNGGGLNLEYADSQRILRSVNYFQALSGVNTSGKKIKLPDQPKPFWQAIRGPVSPTKVMETVSRQQLINQIEDSGANGFHLNADKKTIDKANKELEQKQKQWTPDILKTPGNFNNYQYK